MPRYTVMVGEREFDITLEYHADRLVATVDGRRREVVVRRLGPTRALLLIDNFSHEVDVRANGAANERVVFLRGVEIPVTIEDYALAQMRKAAGIAAPSGADAFLKAPMPGLVVAIKAQPGQQVNAGDPLVVIEAMKMENVLKARTDGRVKAVHVKPGQSIEKNDKLIEFE